MNYLHRYMHRYNMYQLPRSKYEIFENLATFIAEKADLPMTEDVGKELYRKCLALISASARRWRDERLLVPRGPNLGKHAVLKHV